jgi:hypothetical protein
MGERTCRTHAQPFSCRLAGHVEEVFDDGGMSKFPRRLLGRSVPGRHDRPLSQQSTEHLIIHQHDRSDARLREGRRRVRAQAEPPDHQGALKRAGGTNDESAREYFATFCPGQGVVPLFLAFTAPRRNRNARSIYLIFRGFFFWSERRDLNPRPPVPQTGALTGLRYAPTAGRTIGAQGAQRNN